MKNIEKPLWYELNWYGFSSCFMWLHFVVFRCTQRAAPSAGPRAPTGKAMRSESENWPCQQRFTKTVAATLALRHSFCSDFCWGLKLFKILGREKTKKKILPNAFPKYESWFIFNKSLGSFLKNQNEHNITFFSKKLVCTLSPQNELVFPKIQNLTATVNELFGPSVASTAPLPAIAGWHGLPSTPHPARFPRRCATRDPKAAAGRPSAAKRLCFFHVVLHWTVKCW